MLQLLDHLVLLTLKLVSYLLAILFLISSFNLIAELLNNPLAIKRLLYILKTFPSLACHFSQESNIYALSYFLFL